MQSMKRQTRVFVWLASLSVLATPVAAQTPATTGVVVVRAADAAAAPGDASAETVGLGFVATAEHVIASVAADVTDFVVLGADGVEHEATLVAYDEVAGLGLLAVPGGLPAPYRFARDPAQAAQEVHGATRNDAGAITLVPGRVEDVETDAVRHDAFNDRERNVGAPLLNSCGEVVGAAIDDSVVNPAAAGSGLAVPGAQVLARFAADGLTATAVETPCLSESQQLAEAAADAQQRAEAAELAAADAQRQAETAEQVAAEALQRAELAAADPAQAEAAADAAQQQAEAAADAAQQQAEAAADARRQADVARAEAAELALVEAQARAEAAELAAAEAQARAEAATAEARQELEEAAAEAQERAEAATEAQRRAETEAAEAQQQIEAEAAARQQAEQEAADTQERSAAERTRIIRWSIVAGGIVSAVLLLLWIGSRRSVAAAKRDKIKTETLAQAAQAAMALRDEQDRRASEVPAVFLDGVDADGRPISIRIPGSTIAGAGGAVVGRNPFDSTVVLDHPGVSRRHFRLFARGMSVLIEDLNSMNGTKLSGTALTPGASTPLQRGATLQVGDVTLTVTLQS